MMKFPGVCHVYIFLVGNPQGLKGLLFISLVPRPSPPPNPLASCSYHIFPIFLVLALVFLWTIPSLMFPLRVFILLAFIINSTFPFTLYSSFVLCFTCHYANLLFSLVAISISIPFTILSVFPLMSPMSVILLEH